jgi:excinuclease ABC subunit B
MVQLESKFKPAWDQPKAIKKIIDGFDKWKNIQTLLWATGTGKTFTIANIIQHLNKPTLLISHNKTLAAQLATELKHFFPNNAVHYFVSYFDYYQPESYLPAQWLYIEKEATINQEIEMYRLATMASLLSRDDVIVVASVSSLYGLGQKRFFQENCLILEIGQKYNFKDLKWKLLKMQYKPVHGKIEHGMFDFRWEVLDIFTSTERFVYRCIFNDDQLEKIEFRDSTTMKLVDENDMWQLYYGWWHPHKVIVWPATQFIQDISHLEEILEQMNIEKDLRVKEFEKKWMLVEAERIKKRVEYDIRMIRETGFANWIENYSMYFDRRLPWEPPSTIFDYFPDDMCLIIDESHMTIPQLRAMPQADRSRKINLIKHGFRLPSAIDHRPVNFGELEMILNWKSTWEKEDYKDVLDDMSETYKDVISSTHKSSKARGENQLSVILQKQKKDSKTIFLSATPSEFELDLADQLVEQIIRPTWLLDPITYIYPKSVSFENLENSLDLLIKKKPHLEEFLNGYSIKDAAKEIFE